MARATHRPWPRLSPRRRRRRSWRRRGSAGERPRDAAGGSYRARVPGEISVRLRCVSIFCAKFSLPSTSYPFEKVVRVLKNLFLLKFSIQCFHRFFVHPLFRVCHIFILFLAKSSASFDELSLLRTFSSSVFVDLVASFSKKMLSFAKNFDLF